MTITHGFDTTGLDKFSLDLIPKLGSAYRMASQAGLLSEANKDQFGKTLLEALDAEGNRVFIQPDAQGGARTLEGYRPPKSAAELREDESNRERSGVETSLQSRASAFFETLTDPKINEATGLYGSIKGAIGKYTGSQAGVLRGRLDRLASGLVLDAASSLKGALSDKDISFLESTKPTVNQDIALWKDWYENDLIPILKSRAASSGLEFGALSIPEFFPVDDVGQSNDGWKIEEIR